MTCVRRAFTGTALALLIAASSSFAAVEHHLLESESLAAIGEPSERELSVYVPDVPPKSGENYPVFYLFHGFSGTNRTFLGAGYPDFGELGELIDSIHMDQVMDELIASEAVDPMIVVFPHVKRANLSNLFYEAYTAYVTEEIISFIDANYPTIPSRDARAIAGHSVGGSDSIYMGLARPDLFSLIVAYSPYFLYEVDGRLLADHDQSVFSLKFWLYAGENDGFDKIPPETHTMADLLEAHGLTVVSTFDDSDHWDMIGSMISESIVYFSGFRADPGQVSLAPPARGPFDLSSRCEPMI